MDLSLEKFMQMISDHLGIDESEITPETSFLDDLGIDSLSLINFIIKLERKFGIKINLDSIWTLKNIREAYQVFVDKINKKKEQVQV